LGAWELGLSLEEEEGSHHLLSSSSWSQGKFLLTCYSPLCGFDSRVWFCPRLLDLNPLLCFHEMIRTISKD
jgi:hypothetical protein